MQPLFIEVYDRNKTRLVPISSIAYIENALDGTAVVKLLNGSIFISTTKFYELSAALRSVTVVS